MRDHDIVGNGSVQRAAVALCQERSSLGQTALLGDADQGSVVLDLEDRLDIEDCTGHCSRGGDPSASSEVLEVIDHEPVTDLAGIRSESGSILGQGHAILLCADSHHQKKSHTAGSRERIDDFNLCALILVLDLAGRGKRGGICIAQPAGEGDIEDVITLLCLFAKNLLVIIRCDLTCVRDLARAHGVIKLLELQVCEPVFHQIFLFAQGVFHRDDDNTIIIDPVLFDVHRSIDAYYVISHLFSPFCAMIFKLCSLIGLN